MDFVKGVVKKYYRSYNRTLKDGTKKTYQTEQVQVTISKSDNIFDDKQNVFIISEDHAKELEDSEEMIVALEIFNIMLSDDNKKLTAELNEVKGQLDSYDSNLESLNVELDTAKNEINAAQDELADAQNLLSNKEKELSEVKDELDKSNSYIDLLKEECVNLRKQLEETQSSITNLSDKIEEKNAAISDLNNELDNKNLIIGDLNSDIENLTDKIEFLNSEITALNNNNLNSFTPIVNAVEDEDSDVAMVADVKSSVNYTYADYINLQRDYIALLKKYEDAQESLYNEKIKVIHYKNLLDKFKSFILRLE